MLRTYLCQVGEATPMSRVAGTVFGRTKQAVERVLQGFIRQKPPVAPAPQAPVICAEAGRNLATRLHSSSKGLFVKYLQRCQNSELVGAMRSKYGHRGEFRGVGHTLSAFALVGVAAGTQWNKNGSEFKPFYEEVVAIFAIDKIDAIHHQYPIKEHPEWSAKVSSNGSSDVCAGFELINENDCRIEIDDVDDDDDDISILSDEASDDGMIALVTEEEAATFNGLLLSDNLQPQLDCALSMIESQRMELISLRETVSQLSSSLVEILCAENCVQSDLQMSLRSIENTSEEADKQEVEMSVLKNALMKVCMQEQSMRELQMVQEHQQLQLLELSVMQDYCRSAVLRSSFCKRDACCGPGIDDT